MHELNRPIPDTGVPHTIASNIYCAMLTFRTPSQASAYETKYMMRPFTDPPTTHAVPTLWERAKAMFATTLSKAGSAMRLAFRRVWTPQQRRNLILHLEPVEKLVRVLMIIEAITLLVMTPQGLKLRQTTKPCAIPEPPPQVGTRKPHPEAGRIHAAMMTIAANRPRIDPRVAEREAREAEQKRMAALDVQRQRFEDFDSRALNGHFNVIHWTDDPAMRTAPSTLPRSLVLDDLTLSTFNASARVTIDPPDEDPEGMWDLTGPMLPLARRIDALQRILANPWPAIRRLARRIASIPPGYFTAPWPRRYRAVRWAHGCREFYNACILARPAFAVWRRAYGLPPDDPG